MNTHCAYIDVIVHNFKFKRYALHKWFSGVASRCVVVACILLGDAESLLQLSHNGSKRSCTSRHQQSHFPSLHHIVEPPHMLHSNANHIPYLPSICGVCQHPQLVPSIQPQTQPCRHSLQQTSDLVAHTMEDGKDKHQLLAR